MKRIPLSKGEFAIVDDSDHQDASQFKWLCMHIKDGIKYAARSVRNGKKKNTIYLHRYLMNPKKGQEVDHVNGNTLDNRRINLRVCSKDDNRKNKRVYKNNKLGCKGVSYDENKSKKYRARVSIDGRQVNLGYYSDLKEAIRVYNQAASKSFGQFARSVSNQ